ncbi:MAG: tRNA pseudouridine(55) synthase TruB [Acidobacteriota bacterium]
MDGILVVDKPSGWTSHDVVNKIRRFAGTRKVGHLGTLDPSATGVLPLVIGRATRLAQFYARNGKTYEGVIHFGYSTDSYDADGEPTSPILQVSLTPEEIDAALAPSRGKFAQMPPAVSAKKIAGRPAYELARKNLPVELKAVEIEVFELALLDIATVDGSTEARVRVACSAGTYLRSIAHDAGQRLGCGAHLKSLRRIVSGEFRIDQARTMEQLAALSEAGTFHDAVIPAAQLLKHFPVEIVDDITVSQIRNGRDFRGSPFAAAAREDPESRYVKAVDDKGELVAIGEAVMPNLYHPVLVL